MNCKAFVPNKKVIVRINEGDYQGYYPSRIEEVLDDGLVLGLPFIGTVPVPIRVGERISVFSPTRDAVYRVDGDVMKRQLEPIPLLCMIIRSDIVRVQRRSFVRIPVVLNVTYKLKNSDRIYTTYTKDISGGGIKIILPEILKVGDTIQMRIELSSPEDPVNCEGKVVWIDKEERQMGDKLEEIVYAGVRFTVIEDRDRERLIRFLFNYQRSLIKKGWKND